MVEGVDKLLDEARTTLRELEELRLELRDYERRRNEILRMYSTGQVSRDVFDGLMSDLRQKILPMVKKYFELKSRLKELENRLSLVTTKLSVEVKAASEPFRASFERDQRMRQLLNRVGGVLENVRSALKSADAERELRLLDVLLDSLPRGEIESWKPSISEVLEEWSKIRFSYASRIEEIERRIEQLNDDLKLLEVRFLVGEFDRSEYEARRAAIEREIGELRSQLEALQEKLEDLDLIAARCRELIGAG